MPMANPAHPGEIFSACVLKPLGVSVTEAAEILGVSHQALSAVLNTRADLTHEMALRIEKAFGTNAGLLVRLQDAYSLAQVKKRKKEILRSVRVFRPREYCERTGVTHAFKIIIEKLKRN